MAIEWTYKAPDTELQSRGPIGDSLTMSTQDNDLHAVTVSVTRWVRGDATELCEAMEAERVRLAAMWPEARIENT